MSHRPQILAGCLRLLACGPETTRDLALHVGTTRALVAVALHGEPGVLRAGDTWSLDAEASARENARIHDGLPLAAKRTRAAHGEAKALVWLRENPGWHSYQAISDGSGVSYTGVVNTLKRNRGSVRFGLDGARRVLVTWADRAVTA